MPFLCPYTICYLAIFIYSDYKNIFLPSILHFYHHLFAELVHLYNLPLYWVCWGHKRFLVFGCRVVWERPSSSYTSHGLINLRSSTWGKIATVLQTLRLEAQHESTIIKLHNRHHIPHQKFCFYHLPTRGRVGITLGDADTSPTYL